jgi:hypothetical protein
MGVVHRVMLANESGQSRGLGSEDRLHRALALLLGALAGTVLLTREPALPVEATGAEAAHGAHEADAPSRAALEAAIAELARWFDASTPHAPLGANRRLLALGRSMLEPAPGREGGAALVWKNLAALAEPSAPEARPASLPAASTDLDARDSSAAATLAIVLETGAPLDTELPLTSGAASPRRLLALALSAPGARRDGADPWRLDLLSFAVLAGMTERRSELERETLASLGRLEREQRPLTALMGDGAPAAGALEALAGERRQRHAEGTSGLRELQLGTAVFRAVAVLAEPELEQRALRHLNALLFRHPLERDLQRQLLARARTAPERVSVRLEALEALGRLEQALYGAHLAFRREDRPGPSPRIASSMRHAAAELLEQLEGLKKDGAFAPSAEARLGLPPEELAGAAAQALRGLRAARISI